MHDQALENAIELLAYRFLSVWEFDEAAKSGKVASWPYRDGDLPSARKYPDHPLNHLNRGKRTGAADEILRLAEENRALFTSEMLEKIHYHLFDCCPAVRRSLASVLFLVGDQSSLQHLSRLMELEDDQTLPCTRSEMVRTAAGLAIRRLAPGYASSDDTILVVSPHIELMEEVQRLCEAVDMNLYIGEPDTPDVIALGYKVGIIDKTWLGTSFWQHFHEFLEVLNNPDGPWTLEIHESDVRLYKALDYLRSHTTGSSVSGMAGDDGGEEDPADEEMCPAQGVETADNHEHLLVIVDQSPSLTATMKAFDKLHEPVVFVPCGHIDPVVDAVKNWILRGSLPC